MAALCNSRTDHIAKVLHTNGALDIMRIFHIIPDLEDVSPGDGLIRIEKVQKILVSIGLSGILQIRFGQIIYHDKLHRSLNRGILVKLTVQLRELAVSIPLGASLAPPAPTSVVRLPTSQVVNFLHRLIVDKS